MQQVIQQAIYTNAHGHIHCNARGSSHGNTHCKALGNIHILPGHSTDPTFDAAGIEPQAKRCEKLRLVFSVAGNVLGGALLLSGMLMLPQLFVSLLGV